MAVGRGWQAYGSIDCDFVVIGGVVMALFSSQKCRLREPTCPAPVPGALSPQRSRWLRHRLFAALGAGL